MAFGLGRSGLAGTGAPPARTPVGAARPRRAGHVVSAAVACVLAIGYSLAVGGGTLRGAAAAVAPPVVRQLHPDLSIWVGENYLLADDQPAACPASIAVVEPLFVGSVGVSVAVSVNGSKCDGDPLFGLYGEGLSLLVDIVGPDIGAIVNEALEFDPSLVGIRVDPTRACGAVTLAEGTVILFVELVSVGELEALVILPDKTGCLMSLSLSGEPETTADALDD